jgi:hypothetical protein
MDINTKITSDKVRQALLSGFLNVIELTAQRVEQDEGGLSLDSVLEALSVTYATVVETSLVAKVEEGEVPPVTAVASALDAGALYLAGVCTGYVQSVVEASATTDELREATKDFAKFRFKNYLEALAFEREEGEG